MKVRAYIYPRGNIIRAIGIYTGALVVLAACGSRPSVPTVLEEAYAAELVTNYQAAHSCEEARANLQKVETKWAPAWEAFDRPPKAPPVLRCKDGGP